MKRHRGRRQEKNYTGNKGDEEETAQRIWMNPDALSIECGICFMPFEAEVFMASTIINYTLYSYINSLQADNDDILLWLLWGIDPRVPQDGTWAAPSEVARPMRSRHIKITSCTRYCNSTK